jgi:hypothetical protein
MDSIACKVGDLINSLFHFIGASSFVGSCVTYGRIIIFAIILGLIGLIAIWGNPASDGDKSNNSDKDK